jgi:hypothetical protein
MGMGNTVGVTVDEKIISLIRDGGMEAVNSTV